MGAPFYIVFAGVNGAGKSTFFKSDLWRTADMPTRMTRINPDEILRERGGDWLSRADTLAAGKKALHRIESCFDGLRSFNQETTLSGRLALKNIARAKELGYRVFMFYIGLDDPALAVVRVEHRVSIGGHSIDADTIAKRYRTSLSAFAHSLDFCEQALVFDNTVDFTCLAAWFNGTLAWWGDRPPGRSWLAEAMIDDALWHR